MTSETCAADEIAFVYAMNGANLSALAAARTDRIVDLRQVIFNLDRAVRAGLFALHASDTAVSTALSCNCALFVIGAFDCNLRRVINELDDIIGTRACAYTASDTFAGIDFCYVVLNGNSFLRTNLYTVAVSETCRSAGLVSAIGKICDYTVLRTCIVVFSFYRAAHTVAGNECNFFNHVCGFNAENSGNIACCPISSGNAEVCSVG